MTSGRIMGPRGESVSRSILAPPWPMQSAQNLEWKFYKLHFLYTVHQVDRKSETRENKTHKNGKN